MTIAYALPPYTVLADIAMAKGFFRQEGLEVTPRFYTTGKAALEEMLKGNADLCTVADTPIMFAVMNGQKISIIAAIQASSKYNAIIARKDRGIHAPQDLRGRTISVPVGTTADFFLDVFLINNNISRREVKVIDLKPEKITDALDKGEIDAASAFQIFLARTQARLGSRGITFYGEDLYTQTFCLVGNQEFILKHRAGLDNVIRALLRAEEYVAHNPADARRETAAFRKVDPVSLDSVWEGNTFRLTLDQSLIFALEDESRWAIRNGLTKRTRIPDYLDHIYLDGLLSARPKAVRIVR